MLFLGIKRRMGGKVTARLLAVIVFRTGMGGVCWMSGGSRNFRRVMILFKSEEGVSLEKEHLDRNR